MASAGGFNADDQGGYGEPPRTPKLKPRDENQPPLPPDTEEHVKSQTEEIVRNFMIQKYQNEQSHNNQMALETPAAPELASCTVEPFSNVAQVGRQLAIIGDDIDAKYAPHFRQMINLLHVTPETAYESFAGVARKIFHDGNISWGRVITLLCFGYKMAMTVLSTGMRTFVAKIVSYVCKFIVMEKIAKWIAEQGGWMAVLRYIPDSVGWPTFAAIIGVAMLSLGAVWYISKH